MLLINLHACDLFVAVSYLLLSLFIVMLHFSTANKGYIILS